MNPVYALGNEENKIVIDIHFISGNYVHHFRLLSSIRKTLRVKTKFVH